MKRCYAGIVALFLMGAAAGGAPRLSVTADRTRAAVGEHITVTAKLEAEKQYADVRAARLAPSEFFTVAGTNQNQSSSSSVQIVNGKMVQQTSVTYLFYYTIIPKKTGTFSFPSLEVHAGGETFRSDPFSITIGDQPVENPDVKVRVLLSKSQPYVFEQIILTLEAAKKEQSSAQLTREGFWGAVEELTKAVDDKFSVTPLFGPNEEIRGVRERIDGEFYHVFRVKLALFPLRAGTVTIPSIPFQFVVQERVRGRSRDPFFDDFFGFGSSVRQIPKSAFTGARKVTCRELPTPVPDNFTGAVGTFSLSVDVDPETVPAGDAATLKIQLRGSSRAGSMPDPELPPLDGFEVFTPEKSVVSDTGASGLSARKSFKYLIIPQEEGTATVPPIKWVYFDPGRGSYQTLASDPIRLTVTKGSGRNRSAGGRYLTQSEVREVGQDIRYIKTATSVKNQPSEPYKNPLFFFLYPVPFAFAFFSFLYKVQAKRPKDTAKALSTKAGSRARRRIGELRKQHGTTSSKDLLGQIAGVIESYISHRFNFAATGKTLDELKSELVRRGIDESIVSELTEFIRTMDAYRYGGQRIDAQVQSDMLEKTDRFVQQLERSARKERKA